MTSMASAEWRVPPVVHVGGEGDRAFLAVAGLLFAASTAATIGLAAAGVPICGGGTMTWRPALPDAASFLAMWLVMMPAMMMPSLVPMLRRYRRTVGGAGVPIERLTALVAAGYFCLWAAFGLPALALDVALPALGPFATGAVMLIAGALQFTAGKARALTCCCSMPESNRLAADADTAWRYGLHLGLQCGRSSAGLTAVLLAVGMMDLGALAIVTTAITVERLAPGGQRIAHAIGVVLIAAGLLRVCG